VSLTVSVLVLIFHHPQRLSSALHEEEVFNFLIALDTTSGPDGIFKATAGSTGIALVLSELFNLSMHHKWNYSSKMEAVICCANSQVFKYCRQSLEVQANISVVSNTWLNRNCSEMISGGSVLENLQLQLLCQHFMKPSNLWKMVLMSYLCFLTYVKHSIVSPFFLSYKSRWGISSLSK